MSKKISLPGLRRKRKERKKERKKEKKIQCHSCHPLTTATVVSKWPDNTRKNFLGAIHYKPPRPPLWLPRLPRLLKHSWKSPSVYGRNPKVYGRTPHNVRQRQRPVQSATATASARQYLWPVEMIWLWIFCLEADFTTGESVWGLNVCGDRCLMALFEIRVFGKGQFLPSSNGGDLHENNRPADLIWITSFWPPPPPHPTPLTPSATASYSILKSDLR